MTKNGHQKPEPDELGAPGDVDDDDFPTVNEGLLLDNIMAELDIEEAVLAANELWQRIIGTVGEREARRIFTAITKRPRGRRQSFKNQAADEDAVMYVRLGMKWKTVAEMLAVRLGCSVESAQKRIVRMRKRQQRRGIQPK
jgi:hypothetical protein